MHTDSDLGNIVFTRSSRSKCIRVYILKDGIKISLPESATEKEGLRFVSSIKPKIRHKQKQLNEQLNKRNITITKDCKLSTLTFDVELEPAIRTNIHFSLKAGILHVEYPSQLDCSASKNQTYFWNGIAHFLKKEALRYLPGRTQKLASDFGFSFNNVKIQPSKTRWGSCSREKNINYSLYLMTLPSHLVDYVILHELCHTVEMNHGDRFWALMNKVTNNNSKQLRKELKNYFMPQ